ncbi:MAG: hypothetical protein WBM13_09360 [Bacteroidia bacterium]
MTINKNNYEAYFLDYHEENLSAEEVAELLLFVELHPQLKEAFEAFEPICIDGIETIELKNKASFKKVVLSDNTTSGYVLSEMDYLFISNIEKVITTEEKQKLELLLKNNHNFKKQENLYSHTLLKPDVKLILKNKQQLKKKTTTLVPFYYSIAVAASIALLIGIFYFNNSSNNEIITIAETKQKPAIISNNIVNTTITTNQTNQKKSSTIRKIKTKKRIIKVTNEKEITPVVEINTTTLVTQIKIEEQLNTNYIPETIATDVVADKKNIEHNNVTKVPTQVNEYLSIKEFTAQKIKETILNDQTDIPKNKNNKKLNGWDIAQFVTKNIKKITGRNIVELTPHYNDNGNITSYAIKAGKLELSKSL